MQISVYQYPCDLSNQRTRLQSLQQAASDCADSCDVLVCPELFSSGYNIGRESVTDLAEPADGPFNQAVCDIARDLDLAIVYGYPERQGDQIFNSACCVDRNGQTIANHRKLYLSGEYEESAFATGDRYTVFDLNGIRTGLLICFDVEFPESVRACRQQGCDLVVVPTALQDRWSHLTRTLVPTRAFENSIFLVYANYSGQEHGHAYAGNSLIVGPDGVERARAGRGDRLIGAEIDLEEVTNARAAIPYLAKLAERDSNPIRS